MASKTVTFLASETNRVSTAEETVYISLEVAVFKSVEEKTAPFERAR